jgi:uncharacterized protein YaaR (DUF327 family)
MARFLLLCPLPVFTTVNQLLNTLLQHNCTMVYSEINIIDPKEGISYPDTIYFAVADSLEHLSNLCEYMEITGAVVEITQNYQKMANYVPNLKEYIRSNMEQNHMYETPSTIHL